VIRNAITRRSERHVWMRLKEAHPELEALTDVVSFRDNVGRLNKPSPVVDLESWLQILALLPGAACCHAGRQAEAMDTAERKRRNMAAYAAAKAAEAAELGGWYRSGLWDGRRRSDGKPLCGHIYSHPDGRRTFVSDGRYCSNPELQALLTARAEAWDREEKLRPWHQRAGDRLQGALLKVVLGLPRAVVRVLLALVGRNPG